MTPDEIDAIVRDVLETTLRVRIPEGTVLTRSEESKWDSLSHVEILYGVESELDVEFTAEEMNQVQSSADLVEIAESALARANS